MLHFFIQIRGFMPRRPLRSPGHRVVLRVTLSLRSNNGGKTVYEINTCNGKAALAAGYITGAGRTPGVVRDPQVAIVVAEERAATGANLASNVIAGQREEWLVEWFAA